MFNQRLTIAIITFLFVIVSILLAKVYLLSAYKPQPVSAQTNMSPSSPLKNLKISEKDVQLLNASVSGANKGNINDKIKNIQEQLKFINIKNLPQPVQGILHQIQNLSIQPLNGIKNACIQVCSRL